VTTSALADARIPPVKPAFTPHGVVVPTDDGLVVDLGDRLVRLGGTSAKPLLLSLIPLLDGSRTVEELERECVDIPAAHVRRAVAVLSQYGLVERLPPGQAPWPNDPYYHLYGFLDRVAPRVSRETPSAFQALRTAAVGIVIDGNDAIVEHLQDVLRTCGVGQVQQVPFAALTRRSDSVENYTLLLSIAVDSESYAKSCELDDLARKLRMPWLRAAINGADEHFDIGPFFDPVDSPCYRCFHRQHVKQEEPALSLFRHSCDADVAAFVSLVATEIVGVVGHVGATIGDQSIRRVKLADLQSAELRYVCFPDCERCSPMVTVNHPEFAKAGLTVATAYEASVGTRSGRDAIAKVFRESPDWKDLPPKLLSALPQCALSESRRLSQSTAASLEVVERKGRWDALAIATVLRLGVGLRDDRVGVLKRWASTGGNLGSPEAYVLARSVDGLKSGSYFYQSAGHTLARLESRSGSPSVEELLAGLLYDNSVTNADAVIVLTGAFHRLSWKYGPFAYRLMQFDAGVASSQMQSIAANMDLPVRPTDKWFDDAIESALDLQLFEEQVTTVLVLGPHSESGPPTNSVPETLDTNRALDEFDGSRLFASRTSVQLLHSLVSDSRVLVRNGPAPIREWLVEAASEVRVRHGVSLPAERHLTMPLGTVLERRRSVRTFADRGISATDLAAMLRHAYSADADNWPIDIRSGLVLTLTVVVRDVVGIEAGVYRYLPHCHTLDLVHPALSPTELSGLFVQSDVSSAAAQIWISGSRAACALQGSRAYRRMLSRAGAVAHRLSVAAIASGATGAIVAGIVVNAAQRALTMDGWHNAPLLAFACGREASAVDSSSSIRESM